MVSRFVLDEGISRIAQAYSAEMPSTLRWATSYNVKPGDRMPIIRQSADGVRHLSLGTWGYRPDWAPRDGLKIDSVGLDRVSTNGIFRSALERRRCIIPVTGSFVNALVDDSSKVLYAHSADGFLAAAGVYNFDETSVRAPFTFAFITRDPQRSEGASGLPLPVFLTPQLVDRFLGARETSAEHSGLDQLLEGSAEIDRTLKVHELHPRVLDVSHSHSHRSGPSIVRPHTPEVSDERPQRSRL